MLEEPSEAGALLARLSYDDSGWLARFTRDRICKQRERAGEEMEQELNVSAIILLVVYVCPFQDRAHAPLAKSAISELLS